MRVQGHLIQAHLNEIHQVFAKKMLDIFLTDLVQSSHIPSHAYNYESYFNVVRQSGAEIKNGAQTPKWQ